VTGVTGNEGPLPSLSTMWAMQPRFEQDLPAFMTRAAELGYGAIEINHSMDAAHVGAILGAGILPVTGVHAPAPLERHAERGWNRNLNLASTDEEERRLGSEYTERSLELAAEAGAQNVVVHLGAVGQRPGNAERRTRRLYDERANRAEEFAEAQVEARRERAAIAQPYLEAAARTLEELCTAAERLGVTVALECRLNYFEIALPEEMRELLAPYRAEVAGYLHDVGHAEVLHRLGLVDRQQWWDDVGDRLVGLHLHDVSGLTDHRAPGNGDVDFEWLAKRIAQANPNAARTFEINQHEPDDEVASALELMRTTGVL
jgi:sugar phosphate isomerase/epimerase